MRAQPSVSFATRVNSATDERRRRLQEQTGLTAPALLKEAMKLLEDRLEADRSVTEPFA